MKFGAKDIQENKVLELIVNSYLIVNFCHPLSKQAVLFQSKKQKQNQKQSNYQNHTYRIS